MRIQATIAILVAALVTLATACTSTPAQTAASPPGALQTTPSSGQSTSPSPSGVKSQPPVAVEKNPPGDIPDTTQYVPYHSSAGGFVVSAPSGWSRTTTSSSVSFTDKLNTIAVTWGPAPSAPTVSSAKSNDVPMLQQTVLAFSLSKIIDCAPSCTIPFTTGLINAKLTGSAVVITYKSNSQPDPNAPTVKRYRLEVLRFEFFKGGVEAALTLSGIVGADNVDPWRIVSGSFKWS